MAASNINSVVVTGNLTRDPELRHLNSGTAVCKLRIAVNTRRKEGTEWVDKPNYFDVTVWGAQGENCSTYLSKGRPVAVQGRLEWREWEAKEGGKRQSVEIIAESVQFLGSRDGSGSGGGERWWQRVRCATVRCPGRHLGLRGRDRQRRRLRQRRRHPVLARPRRLGNYSPSLYHQRFAPHRSGAIRMTEANYSQQGA